MQLFNMSKVYFIVNKMNFNKPSRMLSKKRIGLVGLTMGSMHEVVYFLTLAWLYIMHKKENSTEVYILKFYW